VRSQYPENLKVLPSSLFLWLKTIFPEQSGGAFVEPLQFSSHDIGRTCRVLGCSAVSKRLADAPRTPASLCLRLMTGFGGEVTAPFQDYAVAGAKDFTA
jgi:hypothetical protein